MRLNNSHINHISNKIALDLFNSDLLTLKAPLESIAKVAKEVFEEDIKKELAINQKAQELLEENKQEVEYFQANERELFWMIKKQVALERNFNLIWDDRCETISHEITNSLTDKGLISYNINKNRVKNIIFKTIDDYSKIHDSIHDEVMDKIRSYKKKIFAGTDEFEIIYERFYTEELRKKGFIK